MSDDPNASARFDVGKVVVISGWIAAIVVAVSIVLAMVYLCLSGRDVPSSLKELGVASITFLFTQFGPLVRDFITGGQET